MQVIIREGTIAQKKASGIPEAFYNSYTIKMANHLGMVARL